MMKKLFLAATMAVLGGTGLLAAYSPTEALIANRDAKGTPVKPGRWHAGLAETKKYAEDNGLPLIAVWSNGDNCSHCTKFESNVNAKPFKNWMVTSGIVFFFGCSDDGAPDDLGGVNCYWCLGSMSTSSSFPFVRFYWKKAGKMICDISYEGDTVDNSLGIGNDDTYNEGAKYAIDFITNQKTGVFGKLKDENGNYYFKDGKYSPVPAYAGGFFDFGNTEGDRLEAEIGKAGASVQNTHAVTVYLARTNNTDQTDTNYVVSTLPGATSSLTKTVVWAKGEKQKTVTIDMPWKKWSADMVGKKVTLKLQDSQKKVLETKHITYVKAENTPANPLWLDEADASTLEFGQWTMNLDAVKDKVSAFNKDAANVAVGKKAYRLVLIEGALWCPDCDAAEKNFFCNAKFTAWAKSRNVALGVVDIPNYPGATAPTLLSRKAGTSYFAPTVKSGLGYLSRKGISDADALTVYNRNKNLVGKNTLNGGWNRPERSNQSRTGAPILLLLTDKGVIAGRFNQFADAGPAAWSDNYLTRLDELLTQVSMAEEEKNDDYRTTKQEIAGRGLATGKLSNCDLVDYYHVAESAKDQTVTFSVLGDKKKVSGYLSLYQAGKAAPLATTNGALVTGLSLTAKVPATNCYVAVGVTLKSNALYTPLSASMDAAAAGSTVLSYTLETQNILTPGNAEKKEVVAGAGGDLQVAVQVKKGETYRFEGLAPGGYDPAWFELGSMDIAFVALKTGTATLTLKPNAKGNGVLYYQIWQTGKIGFKTASASTAEPKSGTSTYNLVLTRTGGSSGRAEVQLVQSVKLDDFLEDGTIYTWDYALNQSGLRIGKQTFVWEDGETREYKIPITVASNGYSDGNQTIKFNLVKVSGEVPFAQKTFALTFLDDDPAGVGTIYIDGANPAYAKYSLLIAKGGSTVTFDLKRIGSSTGSSSGKLVASKGKLDASAFVWSGRREETKQATLTLPAYSEAKTITVTLKPDKGTKVDVERKQATVVVVPENAPEFETRAVAFSGNRFVPLAASSVAVLNPQSDTAVAKYAGKLPPGVDWAYESGRLVFSGAPTSAGTWKAVFRVSNGSVLGLTVTVGMTVTDPAVSADGSSAPVNPSVQTSRTFNDIMVRDTTLNRLLGLVNLTVPRNGRLSARYRRVDGTSVPLVSTGWSELDNEGSLIAELSGKGCSMTVKAKSNGIVLVGLADDFCDPGDTIECEVNQSGWSAAAPASPWAGRLSVSMPIKEVVWGATLARGDAYVTLRMDTASAVNAGKMTYAGVLPDGTTFSGTSVLFYREDLPSYVLLPMLSSSSDSDFSGVLRLEQKPMKNTRSVKPMDGAWPFWCRPDGLEARLDAIGGYYDPKTQDLLSCCSDTFGTTELVFFALTNALESVSAGIPTEWETNETTVVVGRNSLTIGDPANRYALKLAADLETGTVSGTFDLPLEDDVVKMTYKGVIMRGWGDGVGCGQCSLGDQSLTARPFISGTCWFVDRYVSPETGKTKSEKCSCPFSVGIAAGK